MILPLVLSAALAQLPAVPDDEARLLRFPHVQGETVAFCYAGDIWTVPLAGGEARRVTSFDEGLELFPRISPDGRWIAFSGEYSGTRQVYVVPATGGEPRQLTFYPDVGRMPPRGGYDNLVYDWTPGGTKILVRSNRTEYGQRIGKYFLVDPNGGLPTPLPVPEGGAATFSPDGSKLAYNIISREWRTWKRYRAGRAQDVYTYDLATNAVERLTTFEGTDNSPMWLGDVVYYTSDENGTLNLHAVDPATKASRAVTSYTDYDVLFPSRGDRGIVFERGGYLWFMEAGSEAIRRIEVRLADDRPWLRPRWIRGEGAVGDWAVSPSAKRAVVTVRGDVFTVPAEKGEPVRLTETPARRERDVRWSPDGRTISFLAEVGDDYELFLLDRETGEERQLTSGTGSWILAHRWSPDSRRIAFVDRAQRLVSVDVETGAAVTIDRGTESMIGSFSWSGDGAWVTYAKQDVNGYGSIFLSPSDRAAPTRVTSDKFLESSPAFDPEGRYLYFVSARDFVYSDLSFEQRIYAVLLRDDVESPVAFEEDLEEIAAAEPPGDEASEEEASEDEASDDAAEAAEDEALVIDLDGLAERLVVLPIGRGSHFNLEGLADGLLYVSEGSLRKYDLASRESSEVLAGVFGYELSKDRDRILYPHGGGLALANVGAGQTPGKDRLPLDRVRVRVEPAAEWAQIYGDAWRIMRDWFYDPQMHRVDWTAMREKYRPYLRHVAHRADLDHVLGELIGELNVGHAYVQPGDVATVDRVPVGVLGCEWEPDGERYRIARIYEGENWNGATRAPLTEPGVDAAVGDYLIAIEGHEITTRDNPYHRLENTVGRTITLTLSDGPSAEGAREVRVRPVASELSLRYLAWVREREAIVARLSGGRIGYVHVPNTAGEGHRRLYEGFLPLARTADALVIDDRYNGGGHVPWRMVRDLGQKTLNYWSRRHAELETTPDFAFDGPMAMLINGYSSSGGDAFPYYFRERGLGPLIGKKTWGGLVGYSGTPQFVDGGGLAVPGFAFVDKGGEWNVEAFGVAPDIDVFDDPAAIVAGKDPSLERAVAELLRALEETPTPKRPAVPEGPARDR